jgi:hypothetical protein
VASVACRTTQAAGRSTRLAVNLGDVRDSQPFRNTLNHGGHGGSRRKRASRRSGSKRVRRGPFSAVSVLPAAKCFPVHRPASRLRASPAPCEA